MTKLLVESYIWKPLGSDLGQVRNSYECCNVTGLQPWIYVIEHRHRDLLAV